MYRLIFCFLCFVTFFAPAQNKKKAAPPTQTAAENPNDQPKEWGGFDSTAYKDSVAAARALEDYVPREFLVYTKKTKQKNERIKLCFNLVCPDTVLNFCMNDSLCKNPEVSKILFESKKADTTYMLIYVDAFTKAGDDYPQCNSGKETKLVYVRWNTRTNKAKWKQKVICSCMRNIVNMTKDPILGWDKTSVLVVNYYKGGTDFPEIKFDPEHPESGMMDNTDAEAK